jgi:hypothetical protein
VLFVEVINERSFGLSVYLQVGLDTLTSKVYFDKSRKL